MIPIAIDISVRILGQALVLAYAPVCLYVVTLKFLVSMVMALVLSFYFLGADDIVDKVKLFFLNGIGGMISPVPYFDTKAFSKGALRKYYAINRILLSSILLVELSLALSMTLGAGGDKFLLKPDIDRGTFNHQLIYFDVPAENEEVNVDCTNMCDARRGNRRMCLNHVAIQPNVFCPLAITLMVLAIYTIVESILMLCGINNIPSDKLLFDQVDQVYIYQNHYIDSIGKCFFHV